jgi:hypothetical protein
MTTDRHPRALYGHAPNITPGMWDAFEAAEALVAHLQGPGATWITCDVTISARIIDADTLLFPPGLGPDGRPRKATPPRDVVEIFIDTTGVLIVATGREPSRPLYREQVPLPPSGSPVAVRALRATLLWHAKCGITAISRQVTPGLASP